MHADTRDVGQGELGPAARGRWLKFSSPHNFFLLATRLTPWFGALGLLLCAAGLYTGFFIAPTDHQQGEAYRIIFVHVPAAWMSMLIYVVMAVWAGVGLIFNTRVSSMMASALAPTGALFTLLALVTSSLWGKPTWGTWWVWDGRLISELLALFLYLGFIALQASIDEPRRADRAGAVLALGGVINIPVIYFSVQWWTTLHQGPSISLRHAPSMTATMLLGMLLLAFCFWSYGVLACLLRLRCILLERERHAAWTQVYLEKRS